MIEFLLSAFAGWHVMVASLMASMIVIAVVVASVILICHATKRVHRMPIATLLAGYIAIVPVCVFIILPLAEYGQECVDVPAVVTAEGRTETVTITKCHVRLIGEPWSDWKWRL